MRSSRTIQRLQGLLSAVGLLAVILGGLYLLVGVVGDPLPDGGWDTLSLGGTDAIITVLVLVGWLCWLGVVGSVIAEVFGYARALRARTPLRVVVAERRSVPGRLVGMVLVAVVGGTTAATAAAGAATTTGTAPTHTVATQIQHDQQKTADVDLPTVVVHEGDTLWDLAERHLGDGTRWSDINRLNHLDAAGRIDPDQTLRLPADATGIQEADQSRQAETPQREVRVERGDTLSSIARQHLGDADQWPELLRLNRDQPQPAGGRLRHPDVLQPGWVLRLPPSSEATSAAEPIADISQTQQRDRSGQHDSTEHNHREQHEAHHDDQSGRLTPMRGSASKTADVLAAKRGAGVEGRGEATTSQVDSAVARPPATNAMDSDAPDDDWAADVQPWIAPVGVGAVLATCLVGFVVRRRQSQQRYRRAGQQIAMPSARAAAIEVQMRAVCDPLVVGDVNIVLRKLAEQCDRTGQPLPRIRMAGLTPDTFELHLSEPTTDAIAPFTARSPRIWVIDREAAAGLREQADQLIEEFQAPYPALVSLGAASGGQVLVDLEELGALGVCGEPDLTREALAAMVLELATSHWADDLEVTVVGGFEDLADKLDTGRVAHADIDRVLRQLRGKIANDAAVLEQAGLSDAAEARVDSQAVDVWAPEIIMVLGEISVEQRHELADLVEQLPRVAYAVVTENDPLTDWALQIREPAAAGGLDAILQPDGLRLAVQHVTPEVYRSALEFVASSASSPAPPDASEQAEVSIDELEVIRGLGSNGDADQVEQHEDEVEDETAEPDGEENDAPILRLLGPVEIDGAHGSVASGQRNKLTDIAAYLALYPGRGPGEWSEALDTTNPDKSPAAMRNYRSTRMAYLRSWLGQTPDGEPYLPKLSGASEQGYHLHPDVRCDWHQFHDLVGDDADSASTTALEEAVRLVRGRPFGAHVAGMFAWAGPAAETMTAAIVDAVEEYARRRQLEGRWSQAEWALAIGLTCAPEREHLHRMRIRVAYAAGDEHRTREAISRLLMIRDSFDGELEEESNALLEEIRRKPSRHHVSDAL